MERTPSQPPDEWIEQAVTVPNPLGYHMRPATLVAELARSFEHSEVVLRQNRDGIEVDAKNTLAAMSLAAELGTSFTIRARGADAAEAVRAIAALFEAGFDEMDTT